MVVGKRGGRGTGRGPEKGPLETLAGSWEKCAPEFHGTQVLPLWGLC